MDATCKNCNHWEESQQENLGACDALGADNSGMYVLPVVNNEMQSQANILTNADFGCNQFDGE